MPTFIKTGFWEKTVKGYANWLNLDQLISSISAPGPQGPQGIQGPIGPQGVPGPVGPAGLNWQGAWVSGDPYVADDAVGYGGASYFCILATSGTTAPDVDTTHWALLASQGAIGPAGAPGAQGPTGPQGPAGGGSYLVYSAIINVTSFTATVLENTLGVSLTISNPSNGVIRLTAPSATFLVNKTFISSSTAIDVSNFGYFIVGQRASGFFGDTRIDYNIRKYDNTQSATPNISGGIFVEIRVYP